MSCRHNTLLTARWRVAILAAVLWISWFCSVWFVLHPCPCKSIQRCVFIKLGKVHTTVKQLHNKAKTQNKNRVYFRVWHCTISAITKVSAHFFFKVITYIDCIEQQKLYKCTLQAYLAIKKMVPKTNATSKNQKEKQRNKNQSKKGRLHTLNYIVHFQKNDTDFRNVNTN